MVKLREHSAALADCLDRVLAELYEAIPGLGTNLAIDGSDLPTYANGMRDLPNGKPREDYSRSTAPRVRSSVSSDGSSTNGVWVRCGSVACPASGYT